MDRITKVPSDIFPKGVYELHIGYKRIHPFRISVKKSEDLHEFIISTLYDAGQIEYSEQFFVLMLDRANKLYCYKLLSSGGMAGTVVDLRLLFQSALLAHATSIILVHNHPSGNIQPSQSDLILTKRIVDAGKLLEITILDHIIVSDASFYSFANEGLV
jgi:DNA repair protein RadC